MQNQLAPKCQSTLETPITGREDTSNGSKLWSKMKYGGRRRIPVIYHQGKHKLHHLTGTHPNPLSLDWLPIMDWMCISVSSSPCCSHLISSCFLCHFISFILSLNVPIEFVGSLRATGYNGHIILGISPNAGASVVEYLREQNVRQWVLIFFFAMTLF